MPRDVSGWLTRRRSLRSLDEADTQTDAGFTLVEVMVVLLIVAVLLAIAIPTFLGTTKSANDRAAQANLTSAMLNAKSGYHSNGQSYTGTNTVNAAYLHGIEPNLGFVTTNSLNQSTVSVFPTADGKAIVLAAYSINSENCWYQIDNPGGTTAPSTGPFAAAGNLQVNGATVAANTSATPTAGNITFPPTVPGTLYVEDKGDTAAHCVASAPVYGGTGFRWSQTAFPSL